MPKFNYVPRSKVDQYPIVDLEPYLPNERGEGVRLINLLERHGIIWLRQLVTLTPAKLQQIPNLDRVGTKQLIDAVKAHRKANSW